MKKFKMQIFELGRPGRGRCANLASQSPELLTT